MTNVPTIGNTNANYSIAFKGGANLTRKVALKEINQFFATTKPKNLQEVRSGKSQYKKASEKFLNTVMNACQEGLLTTKEALEIVTKALKGAKIK